MDNNKVETEEILSAIREMMGEDKNPINESLPKDILELTKKVENTNEYSKDEDASQDILELTNLVTEQSQSKLIKDTKFNPMDEKNINIRCKPKSR